MISAAQLVAAVSPDAWVPIPLAGGFTATSSFYVPASRQWFDRIELSGNLTGSITNGVTIATLAAAFRPASDVSLIVSAANTAGTAQILILPTGVMQAFVASTATSLDFGLTPYRLV